MVRWRKYIFQEDTEWMSHFWGSNAKNRVFWGKNVAVIRILRVNFHICWKVACVKDLTSIMSVSTHYKPEADNVRGDFRFWTQTFLVKKLVHLEIVTWRLVRVFHSVATYQSPSWSIIIMINHRHPTWTITLTPARVFHSVAANDAWTRSECCLRERSLWLTWRSASISWWW